MNINMFWIYSEYILNMEYNMLAGLRLWYEYNIIQGLYLFIFIKFITYQYQLPKGWIWYQVHQNQHLWPFCESEIWLSDNAKCLYVNNCHSWMRQVWHNHTYNSPPFTCKLWATGCCLLMKCLQDDRRMSILPLNSPNYINYNILEMNLNTK